MGLNDIENLKTIMKRFSDFSEISRPDVWIKFFVNIENILKITFSKFLN